MPTPGIGRFPAVARLPLLEIWDGPTLGMAGPNSIVRRGPISGNTPRTGSLFQSTLATGHLPTWSGGEWVRVSVNGGGGSSVAGELSFPVTTQRTTYPAGILGRARPGLRVTWEYVAWAAGGNPIATVAHGPRSAIQDLTAFGTTLGYEIRGNGGANWELARRLVNAGAITVPVADMGPAATRARFRWELEAGDAPVLRVYRDGVLLFTGAGAANLVTLNALTSMPRPAAFSGSAAVSLFTSAHYFRADNLD